MDNQRISVIIPIRPDGDAGIVLGSIKKANYPHDLIDILVIKGNNPSLQRNEGIRKSKAEIIFFLDDDSEVEPNLFKNSLSTYQRYPEASGIGGPAVLYGSGYLQQAIKIIMTSYVGVYKISSRYKPLGCIRYVDENELISCNLSLKREVFISKEGFNETLYPNEENELIKRLSKAGHKFLYNPECVVRRKTDEDIDKFLRRIFSYGNGRVKQLFLSPDKTSFLRLLPLLFLLYIIILLFFPNPYLFLPFFIYLAAIATYSLHNSSYNHKLSALVFSLYAATHIFYGLGLLYGIFTAAGNKYGFFHNRRRITNKLFRIKDAKADKRAD